MLPTAAATAAADTCEVLDEPPALAAAHRVADVLAHAQVVVGEGCGEAEVLDDGSLVRMR